MAAQISFGTEADNQAQSNAAARQRSGRGEVREGKAGLFEKAPTRSPRTRAIRDPVLRAARGRALNLKPQTTNHKVSKVNEGGVAYDTAPKTVGPANRCRGTGVTAIFVSFVTLWLDAFGRISACPGSAMPAEGDDFLSFEHPLRWRRGSRARGLGRFPLAIRM